MIGVEFLGNFVVLLSPQTCLTGLQGHGEWGDLALSNSLLIYEVFP